MIASSIHPSVLHDLRVLVSSIQTHAKEGRVDPEDGGVILRNEVDLLADVLRILTDLASDSSSEDLKRIDLRAVIWVARSRVPDIFIDSMDMPRRVWLRVGPVIDLLDVTLPWASEMTGRAWLSIDKNALLVRPALSGSDGVTCPPNLEIEEAIVSLASLALFEPQIDSINRRITFSLSGSLFLD
jgi:hypothetical protein